MLAIVLTKHGGYSHRCHVYWCWLNCPDMASSTDSTHMRSQWVPFTQTEPAKQQNLPYLLARWLSTLILQKHRYLIFGSARLHSTFQLVLLWCFQYCTKKLCRASPMPQAYLTKYQAQTPLLIFYRIIIETLLETYERLWGG
jgi:hypothetical protein